MTKTTRIEGAPIHWVGDGFRVQNYLPFGDRTGRLMSPFYLLDYHPPYAYPPTDNERRGVGPHPHRGLETITISFAGSVAHHDSAGGGGVIGPGDVQWMTAGSGLLHKEYHSADFAKSGGELHMLQLWTNLPRKFKMVKPRYQAILNSQMPTVHAEGVSVQVIAGSFKDRPGPAQTYSPIDLYLIEVAEGAKFQAPAKDGFNTGALIVKGSRAGEFLRFEREVSLDFACTAVLMSGEPIDEPLVQYGPFLMNTKEEIAQAIEDFNGGLFGDLPE